MKSITKNEKPSYNPFRVRRAVRLQNAGQVLKTGLAQFVSKSMTDATDNSDRYKPEVNLLTGACTCNCKHFEIRLARHNPTVWSPDAHLCKHLLRSLGTLARRSLLPQQQGQHGPRCIHCGTSEADAYYEVADSQGRAIAGRYICDRCAHDQTDDLSDAAPDGSPCPPHVDPETGELLAGYLPDGTRTPVPAFPDEDDELLDAPKFIPRSSIEFTAEGVTLRDYGAPLREDEKPAKPLNIRPEFQANIDDPNRPVADYNNLFD